MYRYKIGLQYDGTSYYGWQLQTDQRSIQGELERVLTLLNGNERVIVNGAGRTDTGVHATGQVAHFDLDGEWDSSQLQRAINGNLPADIRVMTCEMVTAAFHARYTAQQRIYTYKCRTDDYLLDRHYVWRIGTVDVSIMQQAAAMLTGEHDFTGFSKYNPELENRQCIVYQSAWNPSLPVLTYTVTANRFLHHMVRYLVGSMVAVGSTKLTLEQFNRMLSEPVIEKKIFRAPAYGLVLKKVIY